MTYNKGSSGRNGVCRAQNLHYWRIYLEISKLLLLRKNFILNNSTRSSSCHWNAVNYVFRGFFFAAGKSTLFNISL